MESQVLGAIIPHLNSTLFGFETVEDLINYELTSDDIYTEKDLDFHHRVKRKEDAVMYVNVGGSPSDNACPSIADSSAVSLAQMSFLAMTVSVFTVVATVANNLNNNNNNVNDNNLNFVQQKQNSLSMNQNIVNQINIDLPPPVPGKRSIRDDHLKILLVKMLQNKNLDLNLAEHAMRDILEQKSFDPNCFGRQLCLKSLKNPNPSLATFQWIQSLSLFYLQNYYNFYNISLTKFLESKVEQSPHESECFRLFKHCDKVYK